MRSARQSAIRLLQLMMVASVVLPLVLFALAAWLNYRHEYAVADDRIERSLDILHEHTLKVFQTVERAMAEVNEIVRGMSDDDMRRDQSYLHERVKRIVDALPEVRAIFLINRDGRPLVSSRLAQIPADFDSRERSFFAAQTAGDAGTYVSEILTPRLTGLSTPFFVLSRRRPSADGAFNGVVAVAVLPQYFEEFYALIGRSPGSLYALLRADGRFLARYPERPDQGLQPAALCTRRSRRDGSAASRPSGGPKSTQSNGESVIASSRAFRSTSLPASTARRSGANGWRPWRAIWSSVCPRRCFSC